MFSLAFSALSATEITRGSGFRTFPSGGKLKAPTTFVIVADEERVTVTVDCVEPDTAKLRASTGENWRGSDSVELFLAPDGTVQNHYHFIIPYRGEERRVAFYAEKGTIEPDPYGPDWTGTSEDTTNGWRATFSIPLSSLYMTRNHQWSRTWRVNVTRNNKIQRELSTWAPMMKSFNEPDNFRKVAGFPMRRNQDDNAVESVSFEVTGRDGDSYTGMLRVTAIADLAGDFELSTSFSEGTVRKRLNSIASVMTLPATFPVTGRNRTRLTLTRCSSGKSYTRFFPVPVVYEPIRMKLTTPEYRDNFYPGQETTHVAGTVSSSEKGEIVLELSGDGVKTRKKTLAKGGAFTFDIPEFTKGELKLVAKAGGSRLVKRIRKIEPTGRMMTWISGGNLIVDGKPVFRRNMYAPSFICSPAHWKRYRNDPEMHITWKIVSGAKLEPARLIAGIGTREAKKDVMPCRELLDKVEKLIEESRDKNFAYWYISDEPEMRGVSEIYLRNLYEFVKERDPNHVILSASREPGKYVECADWFETHPYMDPYTDGKGKRAYQMPMHRFGQFIEKLTSLNRSDKCIGFIPTCFSYKFNNANSDYPDFDEYRCHTWAAITAGAKTLFPYYAAGLAERPSLYRGTACVFASCDALSDMLLLGQRTSLGRTDSFQASVWELKGEKLVAAVNFMNGPQRVTLSGLKGTFREFRGVRTFKADGVLTLEMKPFEVVIATTSPFGSDLPTIAAERERWVREEAARVNRDNQLLGREKEIEITGSKPVSSFLGSYALVNGMHEDLCWMDSGTNKWLELSFPKFVPVFREVRLFGSGLDGSLVKVMKRRRWVTLTPKNVKRGDWSLVYDFGEDIRTVKLRLEFPKKVKVGLCEIELSETETSKASSVGVKAPPDKGILYEAPAGELKLKSMEKMQRLTPKVPVDPEHPWVTFRLDRAGWVTNPKWQYHAWGSAFHVPGSKVGGKLGGEVLSPQLGVYVQKLPVTGAIVGTWERHGFNFDLDFGYMRVCASPAHRLEVCAVGNKETIVPGDKIAIRLSLDDPCEDVTCRLVKPGAGPTPFMLNGSDSVVLEPQDETGRVWGAVVTVASCEKAAMRAVGVKCVLLGGTLDVPLYTVVPFGFAAKAP